MLLTQFEVPVDDFLLMDVLQARDYLLQVEPDLWFSQRLSGSQDVGQRLWGCGVEKAKILWLSCFLSTTQRLSGQLTRSLQCGMPALSRAVVLTWGSRTSGATRLLWKVCQACPKFENNQL